MILDYKQYHIAIYKIQCKYNIIVYYNTDLHNASTPALAEAEGTTNPDPY